MLNKMKSRKFLMVVAAAILNICNDGLGLGLPSESLMKVTSLVIGYVLSQGYVDGQSEKAKGGN